MTQRFSILEACLLFLSIALAMPACSVLTGFGGYRIDGDDGGTDGDVDGDSDADSDSDVDSDTDVDSDADVEPPPPECLPGDSCEDGAACTNDFCDDRFGACVHDDSGLCGPFAICAPGVPGVDEDGCLVEGMCRWDEDCVDPFECTVDTCFGTPSSCFSEPDDSLCDDASRCEPGAEGEDSRGCVPRRECGTNGECSDGISCTVDRCTLGRCVNAPNDEHCPEPPDSCTVLSCSPLHPRADRVSGCVAGPESCPTGSDPCTTWGCDPERGCVEEDISTCGLEEDGCCPESCFEWEDRDCCEADECSHILRDGCCPGDCSVEFDLDCCLEAACRSILRDYCCPPGCRADNDPDCAACEEAPCSSTSGDGCCPKEGVCISGDGTTTVDFDCCQRRECDTANADNCCPYHCENAADADCCAIAPCGDEDGCCPSDDMSMCSDDPDC